MQRFQEILVLATPAPETPELVMRAARLADSNRARLTIFDVVPALGSRQQKVQHGGIKVDLQEMLIEARRKDLEDLAAKVMTVDTRVDIAAGVPFLSVIERVHQFGHDLVITAPDRSQSSRGLRSATTTLHLLRKSPCPVWVDDPKSWGLTDALVAIGPLPEDGTVDPLNQTLMELGTSLARMQGGSVHLVHAWQLLGENIMRTGRVRLPEAEVDQLVEEERLRAEEAFARIGETVDVDGIQVHRHLRHGDAGDVIAEISAEVEPGVVVMGTLARTGLSGLIIGNTAERLLGEVDSSVMAVKPPGFESPVGRALAAAPA